MARTEVRVSSTREIEDEIRSAARRDAEVARGLAVKADEVVEFWRSVSPVESGAYAASVHAEKSKRRTADGFPQMVVSADDYKAHWIEFGTGPDPEGTEKARRVLTARGWVVLGRDTPTPAFAPRAKTAAHFGGLEE